MLAAISAMIIYSRFLLTICATSLPKPHVLEKKRAVFYAALVNYFVTCIDFG